jgi:hypothetical protein
MTPVKEARQWLEEHVEDVAAHLLPGGKKEHLEWRGMHKRHGGPGDAVCIHIGKDNKIGMLSFFANGEAGTADIVATWMRLKGIAKDDWARFFEDMVSYAGQDFGYQRIDWGLFANAFGEEHIKELVTWRGWQASYCRWLAKAGLIGWDMHTRSFVFPIRDNQGRGNVIGCHHFKAGSKPWVSPKAKGVHPTPLIFGDLSKAKELFITESQWDAGSLHIASGNALWHRDDEQVAIATRGAGRDKCEALKGLVPATVETIYLWPQCDPDKDGKIPSEDWLKVVVEVIGRPVKVVRLPTGFKDHNDWLREGRSEDPTWINSGKSLEELEAFCEAAQTVAPIAGQSKSESDDNDEMEARVLAIVQSLDAYYDQPRKEYIIKTPSLAAQNYQPHTEAQFKRDLRFLGIASKPPSGQLLSPADIVIKKVQETKYVNYVGALSGKQCGFYYENGTRLLVTSEPQIIEPIPGDFSNIDAVIINLLAGEQEPYGGAQLHSFYGWLQRAYCALRDRKFAPGQALTLAGPVGIGKSLLQNLITKTLGGRCAKPALFLQGRTDFNGEMFEAEHLMLEDEAASTSHAARMALGTSIKNITANRIHACHPKHRPIVNLAPWWRLSISVNDRPERLLILPPLVEDMADKIILLRASQFPMPMPTTTAEEQEKFWNTLVAELPAFLYQLVNGYVVPADWLSPRFGVRTFHHPVLLTELEELSPAIALLGLIDAADIWEVQSTVWEGTALELRTLLLANHKTARDADRLLGWTNACGQYLNDLAKIRPQRVKKTINPNNRQRYEISPEPS